MVVVYLIIVCILFILSFLMLVKLAIMTLGAEFFESLSGIKLIVTSLLTIAVLFIANELGE